MPRDIKRNAADDQRRACYHDGIFGVHADDAGLLYARWAAWAQGRLALAIGRRAGDDGHQAGNQAQHRNLRQSQDYDRIVGRVKLGIVQTCRCLRAVDLRLRFWTAALHGLHVLDRGMQHLAADFGQAIHIGNHLHHDADLGVIARRDGNNPYGGGRKITGHCHGLLFDPLGLCFWPCGPFSMGRVSRLTARLGVLRAALPRRKPDT